eukprot:8658608-Lingulodinium_polyedra.AAC.1
MQEHAAVVQAAVVRAVLTWQHYQFFSRKPRRQARNAIDVRWAVKWKWVAEDGKKERTIRA